MTVYILLALLVCTSRLVWNCLHNLWHFFYLLRTKLKCLLLAVVGQRRTKRVSRTGGEMRMSRGFPPQGHQLVKMISRAMRVVTVSMWEYGKEVIKTDNV